MKIGKPKSKRTPVRLRHKIEKASVAKQRKERKQAKQDPTWRSRLKKDPGIPNLFPYKDRILAEIEDAKRDKQEEAARKREDAKALKRASSLAKNGELPDADELEDDMTDDDFEGDADMDEDKLGDESNPQAALLASAQAFVKDRLPTAAADDEDEMSDGEPTQSSRKDTSACAYKHLFPEVLSQSDVILYVLDARDPQSTRSRATELEIASHASGEKHLILVLNKVDLVPPPVLDRWLKYLRRFHHTLPLRASSPAANAKTYDHKDLTLKSSSETLLRDLKAYAAKKQLKRGLTVGVVGYPNVGKSSVINALVSQLGRKKAPAPTGAEAGVTTALRNIKLDSKLTLLDSPGVIFPTAEVKDALGSRDGLDPPKEEDAHARLVLLNAIPPKAIEDPIPAVQLLLRRVAALPEGLDTLRKFYSIPWLDLGGNGDVTSKFLVEVARKRGRLGKGGVPNLNAAGMTVLGDWRDGRIGAWVEPPKFEVVSDKDGSGDVSMEGGVSNAVTQGDRKEIVAEMAPEFKLDGL